MDFYDILFIYDGVHGLTHVLLIIWSKPFDFQEVGWGDNLKTNSCTILPFKHVLLTCFIRIESIQSFVKSSIYKIIIWLHIKFGYYNSLHLTHILFHLLILDTNDLEGFSPLHHASLSVMHVL